MNQEVSLISKTDEAFNAAENTVVIFLSEENKNQSYSWESCRAGKLLDVLIAIVLKMHQQ